MCILYIYIYIYLFYIFLYLSTLYNESFRLTLFRVATLRASISSKFLENLETREGFVNVSPSAVNFSKN